MPVGAGRGDKAINAGCAPGAMTQTAFFALLQVLSLWRMLLGVLDIHLHASWQAELK